MCLSSIQDALLQKLLSDNYLSEHERLVEDIFNLFLWKYIEFNSC